MKKMKDIKAVSIVIGVILMVAITVAISAVVYVYATDLIGTGLETQPAITFMKQSDGLMVIKTEPNLEWTSITYNITGGTNPEVTMPTGVIQAGQMIQIVNITGTTLVLIYGNGLIGTWGF